MEGSAEHLWDSQLGKSSQYSIYIYMFYVRIIMYDSYVNIYSVF